MYELDDAVYARGYVYNFHFHLIWVTKYRNATFTTPALVNEMKDILRYIADLHDITIEKMEVMSDHVHMLISFKPKYSATNIVKALKGAAREYSCVIIQKSSKGNTGAAICGHVAITWGHWET